MLKKRQKKFISMILTLAMMISFVPTMTLTASAAAVDLSTFPQANNSSMVASSDNGDMKLTVYARSAEKVAYANYGDGLNIEDLEDNLGVDYATFEKHSGSVFSATSISIKPLYSAAKISIYGLDDSNNEIGDGITTSNIEQGNIATINLAQDSDFTSISKLKIVVPGTGYSVCALEVTDPASYHVPTLSATGGTPTFTENGSAVDLFSSVTVATNDEGQSFSSMTLTVTYVTDNKEYLCIGSTDVELTNGQSGSISGIGNYSVGVSGGIATVTISGMTRDNTQMGALIDGISYRNTSEGPSAENRVITITHIADNGPSSNSASYNITATVSITGVNDAPVLEAATPSFTTLNSSDVNNAGQTVASIVGATISDVDSGALQGIAVTTAVSGNGTWEYSTDDGVSWTAVGTVTGNSALLLRDTDKVRFVPNGTNATTASITYRAWDRTTGSQGNKVDSTTNGGVTAFSTATNTASLTVNEVNLAPVLSPATPALTSITEDDTTNIGQTVASIVGSSITDENTTPVEGIAITSTASGNGTWEYSTDNGGTWAGVGAVAGNSALLLRDTDKIRFVPNGQNATTGSITYRAWDRTTGSQGTRVDTTTNGGVTAFSTATDVASITVTALNDAPTLSNGSTYTLVSTVEDVFSAPTRITVNILAGAGINWADVDALPSKGIAITGKTGNGTWQYSTDGNTWTDFGAVTFAASLLLDGGSQIRYIPDAVNGETATFTFRAWDQTTGTASSNGTPRTADTTSSGGTTAFSSQTAIGSLTVAPVNDAPVITVPASIIVTEDVASAMTGISFADVDAGSASVTVTLAASSGTLAAVSGGGVTVGGSGTATMTLTGSITDINAYIVGSHVSFTTLANANSNVMLSVGINDGGNTGGGALTDSKSVTLSVTAVNDAPTLSNGCTVTFASTNEDTTSTPVGITAILANVDWADVDAGAAKGIAITGKTGNGRWQYSTDGSTWTDFGAVSSAASLLLDGGSQIRYVPDSANGETATLTFRAWDQTTGTASSNGTRRTADTTSNGGTTAFSSQTADGCLTVTYVNDPPIDISLTPSSILTTATGINKVVGTLSTNDADLGDTFQYSIVAGAENFNIDGTNLRTNAALVTGTYSVQIASKDSCNAALQKEFTITVSDQAAIGLTAAPASVDHDIVISFTAGENAAFAGAVTGVSFKGQTLTSEQYTVANDKITLLPGSNVNENLRKAATGDVVIKATGYVDSIVSQTITAGAVNSLEVMTQPIPGAESGTLFATQPIVRLKDQYGNICSDGPSASADVTASAIAGTGTWTIGGTVTKAASSGVANFGGNNLTCTIVSSGNGKVRFSSGGKTIDSSAFVIPERNSAINPTTAVFDQYTSATNYKDIAVTLTLNGNTLSSIKNGASTLVANTDYTVSGNTCTIKKEYLKNLSAGTVNLTFDFSLGVDPGLAITVSNTTPKSSGSGSGSSTSAAPSQTSTVVEVNGQKQDAGTASTQTASGQTVTTITVDDTKLNKILESKGAQPTVTLPTSSASNVVVGQLNGQTVKSMEEKEATLEIKTQTVTYTLPASQINIDAISSQIGSQVALKDIKVSVKIAEPPADTIKVVEDTAKKNNYQVVVKPVEFEITCASGNKTVDVSKFNGYVERTVAIPDGIDPGKITTGIVLNSDGTFSHVPTTILKIDGKYYAKINSLTNSTYSVIYNPVIFSDLAGYWAKDAINDMGSRMVVAGVGNGTYEPDRSITRAEFAAIVVRALGLQKGTTESAFDDVMLGDWFNGYVDTATAYSLITGYNSKNYAPNDTITREQAMAILDRAMKLTGLKTSVTDGETSATLAKYTDAVSVSAYAKTSAASCIKTGIVTGSSETMLSPKAYVTRAEVAVMVQRLLQKSGLI